jgi:hypothetical protein
VLSTVVVEPENSSVASSDVGPLAAGPPNIAKLDPLETPMLKKGQSPGYLSDLLNFDCDGGETTWPTDILHRES